MKLAKQYRWLLDLPVLPAMVQEGINLIEEDIFEISGKESNPFILELAKEAGVRNIYTNDDTPWCAVAHTVIALRAKKVVPFTSYDRLRAASFMFFGVEVDEPVLGDTVIFKRPNGFHVGLYIAEDHSTYHIMGGNQSNTYNITRILKARACGYRRPIYKFAKPDTAIKYLVEPNGNPISTNEA